MEMFTRSMGTWDMETMSVYTTGAQLKLPSLAHCAQNKLKVVCSFCTNIKFDKKKPDKSAFYWVVW